MIVSLFLMFTVSTASAQSSRFVYQGSLTNAGSPANGSYDFEFALFDAVTAGTQIGSTLPRNGIPVVNGTFAATLDFGAAFPGTDRFLEIRVRLAGQPAFTTLTPRQSINSAPYAIKSLNTDTATNALQLGGVAANQYVQTADPRLTDARQPTAGSGDYVQNRVTQQAATNFNISGSGTVGGAFTAASIDSATQYNIGGNRVLGVLGLNNVFAGIGAGTNLTTGVRNAFFGRLAGNDNQTGTDNSFFGNNSGLNTTSSGNSFYGSRAGTSNTTGSNNAFFGLSSGDLNSSGSNNAFFGASSGLSNTTASNNSFFGSQTGDANTTGFQNAFFGREAGGNNVTGSDNAFFGYRAGALSNANVSSFFGSRAGESNTTGSHNSFFGYQSGRANVSGDDNAFFGYRAGEDNTASDNAFFGSDSGQANTTGTRNAFFGSDSGFLSSTGGDNAFFGYSAGRVTNGAFNSFVGSQAGMANTSGFANAFLGARAGPVNTTGNNNVFIGFDTATANTTGSNNTFVGSQSGFLNSSGTNNTLIGGGANVTTAFLTFATAIGAGATVDDSNTIVIGRASGADETRFPGPVVLETLAAAAATALCRGPSLRISTCSSSLRYKAEIQPFGGGANIIKRLRPIVFTWKDGGMRDVGFAAEEVNEVEPLLVTLGSGGEIEGVKYGQITTVLVNAVKEQQSRIEGLELEIETLRQLVCELKPASPGCTKQK